MPNVIPAKAGIQKIIGTHRQIAGLPPSRERREFFNNPLRVAMRALANPAEFRSFFSGVGNQ
jgi:hypothetical protein